MRKFQRGLIEPRPVPGFARSLALHLPYDPFAPNLLSLVQQASIKSKSLEGYHLYLLPDKIVITEAISAPLAVMALERLVASGLREVILLGFAGSLLPGLKIGQALLVERAIADEGTSFHYFPRKRIFSASATLTTRIERELKRRGFSFHRATIISTDAPYRETRDWIQQAQKKGAQAVDMETSAIFALATFYRFQAASLLLVSDELFASHWRPGFSSPLLKRACQDYFLPFIISPK